MIVDDFQNKRVLVVGDVILDHFVRGAVDRISPEAPAMVLNVQSENWVVGGAGNVALNIANLGATAILVGLVGEDAAARQLDELCRNEPGLDSQIIADRYWPTIQKTRYIASDRHILRADIEQKITSKGVEERLIHRIRDVAPSCDAMVISDYSKGVITDAVIHTMVAEARRLEIPLVADPKRRRFQDYRGCSILTPNRKELRDATAREAGTEEEIAAAIPLALEQFGGPILLTRSEQGVSLFLNDGIAHHEAARCKTIRDVCGAGDTVAAALTLALSAGASLINAMKIANAAAGVVVAKSGTASVSPRELIDAMLSDPSAEDRKTKLATREQSKILRREWADCGLKVGFTNGCFDIIHPGHIKLLREARLRCDKLIVGLNADSSVKRLKGPERPVQFEGARANVLVALESVDLVTIFDEDTPINLIQAIRPDFIFKGGDYSADQVVGGDFVQSYGGKVSLIDIEPGQSTTRLIVRSREAYA